MNLTIILDDIFGETTYSCIMLWAEIGATNLIYSDKSDCITIKPNTSRTKSQNLNASRIVLQLSLYNLFKSGVKSGQKE